jgi:mRNA interferase MazF
VVIQRGDIWWASLPVPVGSGPGYRRPVLVVQSDEFNQSRIATVIALSITSNVRLAQAPGNVLLSRKATGLSKDSVVNVSQIVTVDKDLLTERIGTLPAKLLKQVEDGLRMVLVL